MKILTGDIGGTKTRLAIYQGGPGGFDPAVSEVYASREHPSLLGLAQDFLATHDMHVQAACFGVAGPVRDGRCRTTNLPWVVEAAELSRELGIRRVFLLNDLEAMAWAIPALPSTSFALLHRGEPDPRANAALIAAGTGLGEAGLAWDGRRLRPFATEGGHATYGPTTDLEIELLRYLRPRYGHVSWERLVSGPGLVTLYEFLRQHRKGETPGWLAETMAEGDAASAISGAALEGRDELASEALDLFVHLFGCEAGNLALKVMARRGVFLGGTIAGKILPRLKSGPFLTGFTAKGRMERLLQTMPVAVLLDEAAPLLGAAVFAAEAGTG